jgi:hypothetical protein
MLDIPYKRDSQPIDDADLLTVLEVIEPYLLDPESPDKAMALLLAKMIFRIKALEAQVAGLQLVPITPTSALLRPFYGCLEDELELAWAAMIMIAAAQQKVAA